MIINCPTCGCYADKPTGEVNRALKQGKRVHCSRLCAGKANRSSKSKAEKIADKAAYDLEYRKKNREALKTKKREWFKQSYDPAKAAVDRKKRSHIHAEYCRQPEYKAWKKEYDRVYRAKRDFGEFWESKVLSLEIRDECLSKESDYQMRLGKNRLGGVQKRKRNVTTKRRELKSSPLGHLATSKERDNAARTG